MEATEGLASITIGIDGARGDQHQIGDQTEIFGVGMGARPGANHDEIDTPVLRRPREATEPFNSFRWREDVQVLRPVWLQRTVPGGQFEAVPPTAELGVDVTVG